MTEVPEENYILPLVFIGISLILLILLSAFFSGFESAINSINRFQFDSFYKKKKKCNTYKIINMFLNNMQMTLSTVLIGNTFVNIAATTLSTLWFTTLVYACGGGQNEALGAGLATGVMTFIFLVFGEFGPKIFARRHTLFYIIKSSYMMIFFFFLFWPISWLLTRMFKEKRMTSATEDELVTLVEIINKEGVLQSSEASLVRNAIRFDETKILSISTKINKVVFLRHNWTKEKIKKIFLNNPHSRLPVKKDNNFIGFLTFKTFFKKMNSNSQFKIIDIIQPMIKVSQYATLDDVLQEMQIQQCHMALVKKNQDSVKILGIVTLEDLIESLVGEIYDEDDKTKSITDINNFTWRVNQNVNAYKFLSKHFNIYDMDKNISIYQWFRDEFKPKRIYDNAKFENEDMIINIKKNKKKNKFMLIFEKKIHIS